MVSRRGCATVIAVFVIVKQAARSRALSFTRFALILHSNLANSVENTSRYNPAAGTRCVIVWVYTFDH